MRYWDSKFKNASPFPLPLEMPKDGLMLAKMAIERITPDKTTKITVYDTELTLPESEDKTWIVSGISPRQKQLIDEWPKVPELPDSIPKSYQKVPKNAKIRILTEE